MIHIRMELWPGGDKSKAKSLGEAIIHLRETRNNKEIGNYTFKIFKGTFFSPSQGTWKKESVEGFPRLSKRFGPWDLLTMCLNKALKSRISKLKEIMDG